MGPDPGTGLRRAARTPRVDPDLDALWQRGRRRRRMRRTAQRGVVVAVLLATVGLAVVVRSAPLGVGPVGQVPETVMLADVDDLAGSAGTVWALRQSAVVRVSPAPSETVAEGCALEGGANGWAVVFSCENGPEILVGPDGSTLVLPRPREVVGVGAGVEGAPWVVTAKGRLLLPKSDTELDLGAPAIAATSGDGAIWVALATDDGARLARVEEGAVTYRVPLSVTPSDITAVDGDVWILGADRVVRVDPTTNREVESVVVAPGSSLVADEEYAWVWHGETAQPLGGGDSVPIPAGAMTVAPSEGRFLSLVGTDVVATRQPSPVGHRGPSQGGNPGDVCACRWADTRPNDPLRWTRPPSARSMAG